MEEGARIYLQRIACHDIEATRIPLRDLIERGNRTPVVLDRNDPACALREQRAGKAAWAWADFDHFHAVKGASRTRDPLDKIEIEKEVLPERFFGGESVLAYHLPQRR